MPGSRGQIALLVASVLVLLLSLVAQSEASGQAVDAGRSPALVSAYRAEDMTITASGG